MRFTTNDIFTRKTEYRIFYVCLNTIFLSGQKLYTCNTYVYIISIFNSTSHLNPYLWHTRGNVGRITSYSLVYHSLANSDQVGE